MRGTAMMFLMPNSCLQLRHDLLGVPLLHARHVARGRLAHRTRRRSPEPSPWRSCPSSSLLSPCRSRPLAQRWRRSFADPHATCRRPAAGAQHATACRTPGRSPCRLEIRIGASRSRMPPWIPLFGFGRVCRLIMFTRSTIALPSTARTRSTFPVAPRSLPVEHEHLVVLLDRLSHCSSVHASRPCLR